jgi:hypothetical protein
MVKETFVKTATTKSSTKSKPTKTSTKAKKKSKEAIVVDETKRKKQIHTIQKTFGSKRFDLIMKFCIDYNIDLQSETIDELSYKKDGYCYLCCKKTSWLSTEYCCNRPTCEEHIICLGSNYNYCFLCSARCRKCKLNYCSKSHIVCNKCLKDNGDSWNNKGETEYYELNDKIHQDSENQYSGAILFRKKQADFDIYLK